LFPRSFKATMKQNLLPHRLHIPLDLSLLHCPTTERWSVCGWMKGCQINHTKWWNTAVEFLVDEINVVKKTCATWCRKAVSGFYTAHEWILRVCSYRRVSKGTGGPWNITAIYAQTCVGLLTVELTNHKTWFIWRHEQPGKSDPIPRCEKTKQFKWFGRKCGK
jgi:hypothetical protein